MAPAEKDHRPQQKSINKKRKNVLIQPTDIAKVYWSYWVPIFFLGERKNA
jgi:hypothetical protein